MLYVDQRWRGTHGIARFATEVVGRLSEPWQPLDAQNSQQSPTSPTDVFNPRRLRLSANDHVYTPGFNAGITRATQVLTIHDLIHLQVKSEQSFAKSVFYNTVVRNAVRRAGVVMTVSDTSAKAIAEWLNAPDVRIEVVGNGASALFSPAGDQARFDRPTFIYVGNLKPHKNVDVLFDALALRPEYDLLVVTADVELAQSRADERGLDTQVRLVAHVSDRELATLYRGAAGALQPSILEGFGLPALEAMSCGTRVAYWTGCESVAEICSKTGIAVQSASDAAEWAHALDALVARSAETPLLMSAEWTDKYDWDAVGARVSRILAEVTA